MITPPRSSSTVTSLLLVGGLLTSVLAAQAQSPAAQNNSQSANAGGSAAAGNAVTGSTAANASRNDAGDRSDNGKASDPRTEVYRKDLDDAKGFAKNNNIVAAEQVLTRGNAFAKDTANWHFETTQKLLQAAHDLSKEGKGNATAVRSLATQSLQRLSDAAAASKDNAVKAKAKADSAFIHDRYMGDPTTAIASYKAALQLAPTDKNVKEALERLEKADANLRAKIRPARK
jgi:hypothetical protein